MLKQFFIKHTKKRDLKYVYKTILNKKNDYSNNFMKLVI